MLDGLSSGTHHGNGATQNPFLPHTHNGIIMKIAAIIIITIIVCPAIAITICEK